MRVGSRADGRLERDGVSQRGNQKGSDAMLCTREHDDTGFYSNFKKDLLQRAKESRFDAAAIYLGRGRIFGLQSFFVLFRRVSS